MHARRFLAASPWKVSAVALSCVAAAWGEQAAVTPERVVVQPDWGAAAPLMPNLTSLDGGAYKSIGNVKQKNIKAILDRLAAKGARTVQLPVLLPADETLLKRVRFAGTELEYSASSDIDGASIDMTGTRIAFRIPGQKEPPNSEGNDPVVVGKTETGMEVSFTRFNVAYRLEVNCGQPRRDARCSKDAYIKSLFKELSVFGGSEAATR